MPQLNGGAPGQFGSNAQMGGMAAQNPESVVINPQASVTPLVAGDMVFQLTSDTSLTIKVKGSDGVVRSVSMTLA